MWRFYLSKIDLSNNQLNGSIPTQWRYLGVVASLNLAHNSITSPIEPLNFMTAMTTINLSFNRITASSSFAEQDGQVGAVFSGLPISIVSADLSVPHTLRLFAPPVFYNSLELELYYSTI